MSWPKSTDYIEAVQNLHRSMADEELRTGQLTVNDLGLPMAWSGGFADVYRIHNSSSGNAWALKCFTKKVAGQEDRYKHISAHLGRVRLPFMVDFRYLSQGIRVQGKWYPALKMRWVEGGIRLNEFVEQYLNHPPTLKKLLRLWPKMAGRLRQATIGHCDLQHGNVLMVPRGDGSLALRLIDYDGVHVPSLAGARSPELGHPAFQHPQRSRERVFSAEVDRFSNLAIYTAIHCLTVGGQELWERFNNADNLLFREQDFQAPASSEVFHTLWKLRDEDSKALVGRLILACTEPLDQTPLLTEVANDRVSPLSSASHQAVNAILGVSDQFVPAAAPAPTTPLDPAAGAVRGEALSLSDTSISFQCTKCGKACQTKSENVGKRAQCPGCGNMITIPSPQARPKTATPEQATMTELLDEMDEELAAAERCPTCGQPYAPGQHRCEVCEGAAQDGPLAPDPLRFTKQRKQEKSNWLINGGIISTVIFVIVGLFLVVKLYSTVSIIEIDGVVGNPEISDAHVIASNAGWLDQHLGYVPAFAGNCEKRATVESVVGAEGVWIYHIKAKQGSWSYAVSANMSLSKGWLNELQRMGYFREATKRPNPINIREFMIKEPMGRTWVLNEGGDPRRMCNLGVMLGSQSCRADLTPLMRAKRGTLAYAIFFSSINYKMSPEQKIAKSCDSDSDVRTFAAEMLLSTLPLLRTEATPSDIDDEQQYESMLTQLAQATSSDEKESIYEQLREHLLEQHRDSSEEIGVQLREEGGLEWSWTRR